MFGIIDPSRIVSDHLKTLRSARNNAFYIPYFILFFVFPFIFSSLAIFFGFCLDKDAVNLLITVFSIFIGLLFNLLLLVFDIKHKVSDASRHSTNSLSKDTGKSLLQITQRVDSMLEILKEVYANISFAILVSILDVFSLLLYFLNIKINQQIYLQLISWISYYLLLLFMLTMMMILKRVYYLVDREM
jgi:hypothetical protein